MVCVKVMVDVHLRRNATKTANGAEKYLVWPVYTLAFLFVSTATPSKAPSASDPFPILHKKTETF